MTRRRPKVFTPQKLTVRIDKIGASGDGLAASPCGSPLYVAGALAGELVDVVTTSAKGHACVDRVLDASDDRVTPQCPHFSACGGCSLQHMSPDAYACFKQDVVASTLQRHGVAGNILPTRVLGAGLRRRTTFKCEPRKNGVALGYYGRQSHKLVDISSCAVLAPGLQALICPLKKALSCLNAACDVSLTLVSNGVDVRILFNKGELTLAARETLAEFAREYGVLRVVVVYDGFEDIVYVADTPFVRFADVCVPVSSGGFLQASAEADALLAREVLARLSDAGVQEGASVVDLFCGRGTLTLPLAQRYAVTGVEADKTALEALEASSPDVTTQYRNLFSEPLEPADLDRFDSVVMDPPRAGAYEQVKQLAESNVSVVVYVSCNPSSFARDAKVLIEGGYVIGDVLPVDQFMWSSHVEVVACFKKGS